MGCAIILGGENLAAGGQVLELLKDQYRHCKTVLAIGSGKALLDHAGISFELDDGKPDPGLLAYPSDKIDDALAAFIKAVAKHRHFERETDPPRV